MRQKAIEILEEFKKLRPVKAFKNITKESEGTNFVLVFLSEAKEEVYASYLCEIMNISRARMSVLLEKLLSKNLIKKQASKKDARKEVVTITNLGKREVENKKNELVDKVIKVLNKVGYNKMLEFIEILKQIKNIFDE